MREDELTAGLTCSPDVCVHTCASRPNIKKDPLLLFRQQPCTLLWSPQETGNQIHQDFPGKHQVLFQAERGLVRSKSRLAQFL